MIKSISSSSFENKIKNVLVDNDDCWFSSHNEDQLIEINLSEETYIKNITIEYQQGFACEKGELILFHNDEIFLSPLADTNTVNRKITQIKVKLMKSQDLYNRFCIYRIIIN
ncbi:hypothetical protein NGRA_0472 [Nosema granulosis]|uniref:Uncharacterized protein n=1 Tax=Nosema granulosis TaxID=83296 RepID=A0A9P6L041_9MICR|nr:hypothetical protein NGRA_0472 [Nosema granulosis]